MTRKHWTAVLVVIGLGIVSQIPGHEEAMTEHRPLEERSALADAAAANGPYRTIALEVTGMT